MHTTVTELERPKAASTGDVPASSQTVRADSLLTDTERVQARKRGFMFGIEVDGQTYVVPGHRQVPAHATIPRTSGGSLYGVAAVTGG